MRIDSAGHISPLFILKQVHSGEKAISPNFHWDVPALLENLSTSQSLLRPIINTMTPVSRGAISFKGATPESCKVETHINWQLEECCEWRRVGEEVREAELGGEVRYLGFAALLTLGERERAGELLTPEEAFRASSSVMTHCISVWLDMLSSKSQSAVGVSHVRQTTLPSAFLSLLSLSSLSFSQHYPEFQGVGLSTMLSRVPTWKTNWRNYLLHFHFISSE